MTLVPGSRVGPFEIHSAIGAGGMGEVYRARDTKLGRNVALKVLPAAFAADPERLARFRREAQLLATLNHSHIAQIYGLEEIQGQVGQGGQVATTCIVMELVEGEDLAQRIAKGAIPIDEALAIARQIADALEAAHEKGIVHRDLKPANIKLRPDGAVKVLDFGLAKLTDPDQGPAGAGHDEHGRNRPGADVRAGRLHADLSNSPTLTAAAMTGVGMILGTAAYMSPEQARGRVVDKRTDIWGFGCVLFEMISGRRAFPGDDATETIAAIVKSDPDWRALPATPPPIRALLERCLRKDAARRLRDIGDAKIDMEDAATGAASAPEHRGPRDRLVRWERIAWAGSLALLALIAGVLAIRGPRSLDSRPSELRFEIATPPTHDGLSIAISPDGRKLVFSAEMDGRSQLWLRPLNGVSAQPLARTDGATFPFWSPDSRSIGFFADGKIQRLDLEGGSVQPLATAPFSSGATWSPNGTVLFSMLGTPILRASDRGTGGVTNATRLEGPQAGHRAPVFLPDGRHFLYLATGTPENRGIYVSQTDVPGAKRLFDTGGQPASYGAGHLFFVRQGTLFAQPFDAATLELTHSESVVAEHISGQNVVVSASNDGTLVYRNGASLGRGRRRYVWVDRSGREIGQVGDSDPGRLGPMSLSPDGRSVTFYRAFNANVDVWVIDAARGVLTRVTSDAADDVYPVWSRDGARIAFSSNRGGEQHLYVKAAAGTGPDQRLDTGGLTAATPVDWSSDEGLLLYRVFDQQSGYDIWASGVDGSAKPRPIVQTPADERDAQLSPDGRWLAYESNESGRYEIYLQPFPGPGAKRQVSTAGGVQVRWRRDGRELFYVALDSTLTAVPIAASSPGGQADSGTPVPLFRTHVGGAVQQIAGAYYAPSQNGERFLMNELVDEPASPITVIANWLPAR